MRVLVVDDNPDMVESSIVLLRAYGHEVQGCNDASDALGCVREFDPHVVLLDLRMPGKDGWAVAQEIRAEYPAGKRPLIIAVTGELYRRADKPEMKGLDYYLNKPVDPKVLLALIDKAGSI